MTDPGWQMNERGRRLLAERPAETDLPERVERIVGSGFNESNGCLYISALENQDVDHESVGDRTGLEALVNHFHIHANDGDGGDFWIALEAAERLATALGGQPETGSVRVVVSRDEGERANSIVRIFRRRPSEPWLADDIEGYNQPVGFLDVR